MKRLWLVAGAALVLAAGDAGAAQDDPDAERGVVVAASTDGVRVMQQDLHASGFYPGRVDGIFGPQTRRALQAFEQANRLPVTDDLDRETLRTLHAAASSEAGASYGASGASQQAAGGAR